MTATLQGMPSAPSPPSARQEARQAAGGCEFQNFRQSMKVSLVKMRMRYALSVSTLQTTITGTRRFLPSSPSIPVPDRANTNLPLTMSFTVEQRGALNALSYRLFFSETSFTWLSKYQDGQMQRWR
ncbi:hypothetical protein INR49_021699 [Caranx melampygus]|nr:hypothetical protein INR49_021699 [Caranx melampygus]